MNLPGFIARRYLFAKKSHNVINIVSGISAAGIATGCAALIIILSIYNGFDRIIRTLSDSHTPDLLVQAADGRRFDPAAEPLAALRSEKGVRTTCGTLEEKVYLRYDDRQCVAVAKGVDADYQEVTGLQDYLTEGTFTLVDSTGAPGAVIGRTLALELGLRPVFLSPLEVWFPSRTAEVSLFDPFSALHCETLNPTGIVSLEQGFDKKYVFLPLAVVRRLLEEPQDVSALEVYFSPEALTRRGLVPAAQQKRIAAALGDAFTVKNRHQQNDTVYKLLSYEKIAIYAILLFIVLIISCNIFGSLSMLVIEKQADVKILESMGADRTLTRGIFVREGWYISLLGVAIGTAVGLLVCFLQQQLGLVKMPGNFVVEAYPVVVRLQDVLITVASVSLIGYLAARLARA